MPLAVDGACEPGDEPGEVAPEEDEDLAAEGDDSLALATGERRRRERTEETAAHPGRPDS